MLRRAFASGPTRQRMLQQARHLHQTSRAPLLKAHAAARPSAAVVFNAELRALELTEARRTWHQATNGNVLSYWKSAALAAGACGALGLLDEQQPTACASSKDSEDDPIEQAKKKVQELSTAAIAQLAALLPEDYSNLQKKVDEFLASGKGGQISWGFCMGACAGFAMKKVSKLGAVAIGSLFILLQCASYSGYVDVDYKKLERDVKSYLDVNKDGVFDTKDLDSMYKSVMKVLEFSLPAGSGFAAGFMIGFRSG
ncbi:FUN14 domain-containing protein 1 [Phytophthora citrophthora]|uniref:FUN14 domain-containing protein 1 n=1 Tax=Phytophthora citrophthora TaxID=4793 RepID=A0AAD9GQS0_9STRA|nr:FUN14 domain-containing protein 1 [Phytophthora citrophthora]